MGTDVIEIKMIPSLPGILIDHAHFSSSWILAVLKVVVDCDEIGCYLRGDKACFTCIYCIIIIVAFL